MKKTIVLIAILTPLTFFVSCASAPKNITQIASTADPSQEVTTTRWDIDMEKSNELALLSPEKFKKAEKSLETSENLLRKNAPSEKVLEELAISRTWLEQSREIAQRTRPLMAGPLKSRDEAIAVKDVNNKEIIYADKSLKAITAKVEEGYTVNPRTLVDLKEDYLNSEKARTRRSFLFPIDHRIHEARNLNARKLAPVTYDQAQMDYETAEKTFSITPYDRAAVMARIKVADNSSKKLIDVTQAALSTAKKTPEEIVLAERQQAEIAKAQKDKLDTKFQNSLAGTAQAYLENERLKYEEKDLKNKLEPQIVLEELRHQIPVEQADIMMTADGQIKLRLKNLQFKAGSADLTSKATASLETVKNALAETKAKKLVVEGHTDTSGSEAKNKIISEHRAESVATFLQTDASLKNVEVETVGLGSEMPIKNNSTKQGRLENRRVDITLITF